MFGHKACCCRPPVTLLTSALTRSQNSIPRPFSIEFHGKLSDAKKGTLASQGFLRKPSYSQETTNPKFSGVPFSEFDHLFLASELVVRSIESRSDCRIPKRMNPEVRNIM